MFKEVKTGRQTSAGQPQLSPFGSLQVESWFLGISAFYPGSCVYQHCPKYNFSCSYSQRTCNSGFTLVLIGCFFYNIMLQGERNKQMPMLATLKLMLAPIIHESICCSGDVATWSLLKNTWCTFLIAHFRISVSHSSTSQEKTAACQAAGYIWI